MGGNQEYSLVIAVCPTLVLTRWTRLGHPDISRLYSWFSHILTCIVFLLYISDETILLSGLKCLCLLPGSSISHLTWTIGLCADPYTILYTITTDFAVVRQYWHF